MVNWEIIKRPLSEGGLQVRDPESANLSLGGKLVWHLFADKNHHVSNLFSMKYLKGGSLRNVIPEKLPAGTTIWNMCKKSFKLIQQQIFRIPRNGKGIILWEDKIMGHSPISSINSLSEFKHWLSNKVLIRLADIFS